MTSARIFLGATRASIGIGSWVAPDLTMRVFGIDPDNADRFFGRLFGARELALAAVAPVAALGAAVDAIDSIAGFDEARRGNMSTRAIVLGPVGALLFVALGVHVAQKAAATTT